MRVLAILALFAVAGCGVDGAPVRPTLNVGIGLDGSVKVKPVVKAGPVTVQAG